MKITGQNTIAAPVETVWEALLDPRVLVATIPGCERLEATGENAYAMTVSGGVAAIRGTYTGSCTLDDLKPCDSLTMCLKGAGASGTIDATVAVSFAGQGEETVLSYDADAVVGGMIGGVGQRMLTSVSRRMAKEFFGNVEKAIAGELPATAHAAEAAEAGEPAVFAARPSVTAPEAERAFLAGLLVGGALVVAGAVVGGILGRRR